MAYKINSEHNLKAFRSAILLHGHNFSTCAVERRLAA